MAGMARAIGSLWCSGVASSKIGGGQNAWF